MIMNIIISQAISEYISAEGRLWISSSEYLQLQLLKNARVISSIVKNTANNKLKGTEIGMSFMWCKERKDKCSSCLINQWERKKRNIVNKKIMENKSDILKSLDSTLWLIVSHLGDLNKTLHALIIFLL